MLRPPDASLSLLLACTLAACQAAPSEPMSREPAATATGSVAVAVAAPSSRPARSATPRPKAEYPRKPIPAKSPRNLQPHPDDPAKGRFTLADALAGVAGSGGLLATITTTEGELRCRLYEEKAPITVANFIGLARGLRPFLDAKEKKWVKRPAYDGAAFYRVVPGFVIQAGLVTGGGFEIPDEVWEDAWHDRPGLLCMANRGPDTNSTEFFILDGPAPHLDGGYTIFGECEPTDLVSKIAKTPRLQGKVLDPVVIQKVTVTRSAAAPSASAAAPGAPSASSAGSPTAADPTPP